MATQIDPVDLNRYEIIKTRPMNTEATSVSVANTVTTTPANTTPTNVAITGQPISVVTNTLPSTKSVNYDAFNRLRTSNPYTLFDSQHRYQENDKWDTQLTGSATKSYVSQESSVYLSTTTASKDAVLRETKRVFAYQPGKSLLIMSTFVMSPLQTNLVQRTGFYGATNGVFFEVSGNTLYMVQRSASGSAPATSTAASITGTTLTVGGTVTGTFAVGQLVTAQGILGNTYITALGTGTGGAGTYTVSLSQTVAATAIQGVTVTETRIPQSSWNGDKFDGTGLTGEVLDPTKSQIWFCDIEWLGVGSVRTGFVVDGVPVLAHRFDHDNVETKVYMTTSILPLRYEIFNTGAIASAATMKQICSTVISEGGYEGYSRRFNIDTSYNPVNLATAGTVYPIIAIRLNGNRLDQIVLPVGLNGIVTSNTNVQYQLLLNPTLTGGTWTTHTNGNVDYNTTATAVSGGSVVAGGYITNVDNINLGTLSNFNFQLGRTISGVSDILCFVYIALSPNTKVLGDLSWYETV